MPSVTDPHADGYSSWKGWSGSRFGVMGRGDDQYFRDELRGAEPPEDGTILEVGYGNGAFLAYARSRGWRVMGTELLPELIAEAREAGYDARSADDLSSIADGSVNLIAAFDVFEHIDPDSSVAFLTSLRDKLAAGGTIILRYPNADSWLGNPFQYGDPTHVNAIGWLKMTYYAQSAGLRIRSYRAVARRGFATSFVHGIHRLTAGTYIRVTSAIRRAIYLPAIPVVLSGSNIICVLERQEPRATA